MLAGYLQLLATPSGDHRANVGGYPNHTRCSKRRISGNQLLHVVSGTKVEILHLRVKLTPEVFVMVRLLIDLVKC